MSTTSLTGQQVLQEVYDPAEQALRVETVGSSPITGDVNIFDSNGNPLNSTSGSLDVNVTNTVTTTGTSTVSGTVDTNLNGLNVFQTSQYTIGTTAVQLTPSPLATRSSMSIKANTTSPNIIYVGPTSSVTTTNGYALFNGDSIQLDLTPIHQIWAIASAVNQLVYVLEIGE